MKLSGVFALVAACAVLAACNNSSNNSVPTVTCAFPSGTQVALAYPPPGSTGIPDAPGQFIIAASPALPSNWNVVIFDSSGNVPAGGALPNGLSIAPSPYPSPLATPSFANPTYETDSTQGAIYPSGKTFTVGLNDLSSTCNAPITVGTFTTQ